jgi:hypothetical protein
VVYGGMGMVVGDGKTILIWGPKLLHAVVVILVVRTDVRPRDE